MVGDRGSLGDLPIGKRKRAMWRAYKRFPEDPRLLDWIIVRQMNEMSARLCEMLHKPTTSNEKLMGISEFFKEPTESFLPSGKLENFGE